MKIPTNSRDDDRTTINGRRRFLLQSAAVAAGSMLGTVPLLAKDAGQVVVRGLGGTYQDAMDAAVHKPFTQATGIEVIVQPMTSGQIRGMVEAKRVQIDVADLSDYPLLSLEKIDALEPIDYDGMKLTNPADIRESVRRRHMVGNLYFATALTYNKDVFRNGEHPKSWADFWDVKRFPGPRTLADQRSGAAELEFALLADGVPMEKLYPLDIDRAFASLSRIKQSVVKWWDTGAVSTQLLERKEAVLGGIWNGRSQALIDKGAPLGIEWNQAKRQVQCLAVLKGCKNLANAHKFIDFALQPKVQAELTRYIAYGPTNTKAFQFIKPNDLEKLPGAPGNYNISFDQNSAWWGANLDKVGERWQSWVLGGA